MRSRWNETDCVLTRWAWRAELSVTRRNLSANSTVPDDPVADALLYDTGLRREEASLLDADYLDLDEGVLCHPTSRKARTRPLRRSSCGDTVLTRHGF